MDSRCTLRGFTFHNPSHENSQSPRSASPTYICIQNSMLVQALLRNSLFRQKAMYNSISLGPTAPIDLRVGETFRQFLVSRTSPPPDICKKSLPKKLIRSDGLSSSFDICSSHSGNGRRDLAVRLRLYSMTLQTSGQDCRTGFSR